MLENNLDFGKLTKLKNWSKNAAKIKNGMKMLFKNKNLLKELLILMNMD